MGAGQGLLLQQRNATGGRIITSDLNGDRRFEFVTKFPFRLIDLNNLVAAHERYSRSSKEDIEHTFVQVYVSFCVLKERL